MPKNKRKQIAKKKVIETFKLHDKDTGSVEVQIGILTKEIKELVEHLQKHRHDHSSRRGLLKKVGKRRKLLRYLEANNPKAYAKIFTKIKK